MTSPSALTEATMDKMTVEKIAFIRSNAELGDDFDIIALCDLAKIALSPPQDVAGLVEELRLNPSKATGQQGYVLVHEDNMTKLLDCVTSLSARIRGLEAENRKLKASSAERGKALVPLVKMAEAVRKKYGDDFDDDAPVPEEITNLNLSIYDCVRAATLQGGGDE